jgi:hypothetical protein
MVNAMSGAEVLLISDGDIVGSGSAQTLTIYNESDGTSESFTASLTTDGRGRSVTVCEVKTWTTLTVQPGDTYWCIWTGATHGIVGDDNTSALTQAGDLLIWWLRRSRIRWDSGRLEAARQFLNKFKIDTFVQASPTERISPWAWIQENMLPILPASARIGPNGLYFVVWDYFATSDDAVAHIEQGRNARRDGAVDIEGPDQPAGTVTLKYQWAATRNAPEAYAGRSDNAEVLAKDSTYSKDLNTSRAGAQYVYLGYRESLKPTNTEIEGSTEVVRDAFTAGLILAWWTKRDASTYLTCDYMVDQEDAATLSPGAVVTITDSGRGFAARACLVTAIAIDLGGQMRVSLSIPPVDMGKAG